MIIMILVKIFISLKTPSTGSNYGETDEEYTIQQETRLIHLTRQ